MISESRQMRTTAAGRDVRGAEHLTGGQAVRQSGSQAAYSKADVDDRPLLAEVCHFAC